MGDCEHSEHTRAAKGSKINWGTIIAGAAVAAGALLVAPIVIGMVSSIGGALGIGGGAAAGGAGAAAAAPAASGAIQPSTGAVIGEMIKSAVKWVMTNNTIRSLAGMAMVGVGLAHLTRGREEEQHNMYNDEMARLNRETFADTEAIRVKQNKMVVLAAAGGNEQAKAMLAQIQGRT